MEHDHHHHETTGGGTGHGHKFDPSRLERLRDPVRLEKQNPDAIWKILVDGLEVRTLVDLGAGIGFYAIPFARRLAAVGGKVYAGDVNPEMLEYLRTAVREAGVGNVEPMKTGEVEVPLPDGCADAVLMVNLHHELDHRARTLAECRRLLRPGGRILLVDWARIATEKGPPLAVRFAPADVRGELEAAGFEAVVEHAVLPEHWCVSGIK